MTRAGFSRFDADVAAAAVRRQAASAMEMSAIAARNAVMLICDRFIQANKAPDSKA